MTILQAAILGLVQGATEFIPVSSSAHLVLVPWVLGWEIDPLAAFFFDILVQWGTLLALIVYFWQDLRTLLRSTVQGLIAKRPFKEPEARLAWLLVVASLPAVAFGLAFKDTVASTFNDPAAVSVLLLITALGLFLSERIGKHLRDLPSLAIPDALWIGAAQALSLFPGISRSGATIAAGLGRNFKRSQAARFSFLMAFPVMIAAGVLALVDSFAVPETPRPFAPLLVGSVIAAIIGYLAIRWLLAYLSTRPLTLFAVYCLVIGSAGLVFNVLRS